MGNETVSFYSRRILTEQGMVEGVLQVADGKFAGLIENPNPAPDRGRPGLCGSADLRGHHRSAQPRLSQLVSQNDRQGGNSGFIENSAFDWSHGDAGDNLGLEGA